MLAGTVGYFLKDNLKAVILTLTNTKEELEIMLDQTYREVDRFLENNPNYNVRPFDKLEEKLHHDKIISDDEFLEILTGQISVGELIGEELVIDENNNITIASTGDRVSTDQIMKMKNDIENSSGGNKNDISSSPPAQNITDTSQDDPTKTPNDNSKEISEYIARMYVLKSGYTSSLDSLYNKAIAEYKALPESQKESGKTDIINTLYPQAAELEKQCDAQVKDVLASLTVLLKEDGQSLELVDTMRVAYYQEKSVRKAMYMEKL